MTLKTTIKTLSAASVLLLAAGAAKADNYGCEALMCFAGGKGVSECQPTIKRVLKDLAKGRGFPHCSFVNSSGGATGSGDEYINTKLYKKTVPYNQPFCQDGVTRPHKQGSFIRTAYCNTIEINIKEGYAVDKNHQQQFFNYD